MNRQALHGSDGDNSLAAWPMISSWGNGNVLDIDRRQPLYIQLRDILKEEIASMEAGQRLPTDKELMAHYQLSSTTVRQALQLLVNDGLVSRRAGRGTFVSLKPITEILSGILGFSQLASRTGLRASNKLVESRFCSPPEPVRARLKLPPRTEVWKSVRVRYVEDLPVCVQTGYWRKDVGELLVSQDAERGAYYSILEQQSGITMEDASEVISVGTPSSLECSLLELPKGSRVLSVERVTIDSAGVPCEASFHSYHPDRYRFTVWRHRTPDGPVSRVEAALSVS